MKTIILGTRGSQLALAQAELAKQAVERLPGRPEAIIRITTTTGDRRLDRKASAREGVDKWSRWNQNCEMKLTAAYKKIGDWWAAWVEEIPGVNTKLILRVQLWKKRAKT